MAQICETLVTIEQVTEQINNTLDTNATILSHDEIQIGLDQGFLSKVVKIHNIVWSDGDSKLPKSVVAKIPQIDNLMKLLGEMKESEDMKKTMMNGDVIRKATRIEGKIYEMFSNANISSKLCASYGSVIPAQNAEDDKADDGAPFILIEDLSDSHTADIMNGITKQQFIQIAEVLADVQAWSIINRSKWIDSQDFKWDKSKFFNRERLDKSYENFRTALEDNDVMKRVWNEQFGSKLAESIDDFKLSDIESVVDFKTTVVPSYFEGANVPSILVHGDCHPFNMMFKGDKLTALIDWQGCREGHPFEDFIRLMASSPDDSARLEWWPEVFNQWYDRITKKLGDDHKLSMSKADLWKLYEIAFYYSSTMIVPSANGMSGLKDGMVKGFVADIHIPKYMGMFCRMMRDGLEIKKKYQLK